MKIQKYVFIQKFQDEKISEITDWTEEVYGDFVDIVCIIHNAMSTKDNLFRQLDYWIEEKSNSNWAYVWVEVDSIDTNNGTQAYMYYGNSEISTNVLVKAEKPVQSSDYFKKIREDLPKKNWELEAN